MPDKVFDLETVLDYMVAPAWRDKAYPLTYDNKTIEIFIDPSVISDNPRTDVSGTLKSMLDNIVKITSLDIQFELQTKRYYSTNGLRAHIIIDTKDAKLPSTHFQLDSGIRAASYTGDEKKGDRIKKNHGYIILPSHFFDKGTYAPGEKSYFNLLQGLCISLGVQKLRDPVTQQLANMNFVKEHSYIRSIHLTDMTHNYKKGQYPSGLGEYDVMALRKLLLRRSRNYYVSNSGFHSDYYDRSSRFSSGLDSEPRKTEYYTEESPISVFDPLKFKLIKWQGPKMTWTYKTPSATSMVFRYEPEYPMHTKAYYKQCELAANKPYLFCYDKPNETLPYFVGSGIDSVGYSLLIFSTPIWSSNIRWGGTGGRFNFFKKNNTAPKVDLLLSVEGSGPIELPANVVFSLTNIVKVHDVDNDPLQWSLIRFLDQDVKIIDVTAEALRQKAAKNDYRNLDCTPDINPLLYSGFLKSPAGNFNRKISCSTSNLDQCLLSVPAAGTNFTLSITATDGQDSTTKTLRFLSVR